MNWAERHLNWSLVLGVVGAGFAIYILNLILALLLGDFGGVIGFIIGLVLVAYVAGWHVQRKGRNLWNALWIFAPFGIVLLLCLKNLTRKETELKASAEKEKHEISTAAGWEEEYRHSVWEIYRKEWATASPEKRTELNKRMLRWQELMKNGLTASQAYYRAMQEESDYGVMEELSDIPPSHSFWAKMRKAPFVILGLALVVAIVYCVVITGDRNALNTELESVQSVLTSIQADLASTKEAFALTQLDLASTQADLSSTKQTLASTQTDLASTKEAFALTQLDLASTQTDLNTTKQTLASTQTDLASTKQTLASKQSELTSTKGELTSVQQDLTNVQATLSKTQQQLAVAQETLGGLGITLSTSKECSDVALIDNSAATNPTWRQLMTFLSQDQTDKHTYIKGVYDCSQFSRDVHNNAEAAGIRAAEVQVKFRNEVTGHALNAFLTTDYGLVYVDCTEIDTVARIKAKKEYRAVELRNITGTNVRNDGWWDALSSYYYFSSDIGGHSVTSSIRIYW